MNLKERFITFKNYYEHWQISVIKNKNCSKNSAYKKKKKIKICNVRNYTIFLKDTKILITRYTYKGQHYVSSLKNSLNLQFNSMIREWCVHTWQMKDLVSCSSATFIRQLWMIKKRKRNSVKKRTLARVKFFWNRHLSLAFWAKRPATLFMLEREVSSAYQEPWERRPLFTA